MLRFLFSFVKTLEIHGISSVGRVLRCTVVAANFVRGTETIVYGKERTESRL
jgi:hypothetical protein